MKRAKHAEIINVMKILHFFSFSTFLFITQQLCLFGNIPPRIHENNKSIVPIRNQVSDFETQFVLAKILSHHENTQEAALNYFEALLNDRPLLSKPLEHPKIEQRSQRNTKKIELHSIVPINQQVNEVDTRWALARVYSHEEETQNAALTQYVWLLAKKPDNVEISIEMARLYITMKKFHEGLALFYSALEQHPHNLKLLIATAQGEVASGHAEKAKALFAKAFCIFGESSTILLDYADAMMMWGDFYQAENIYRNSLENDPCSLDLRLKLAWSLASPQRYEEAEGIYTELLFEWPNNPKILEALTRLKYQEMDFNKAHELVEGLLLIDPSNSQYLQLKADILFKKEDYCKSIATYNEFTNDRKYGVHAYVGIGRAYLKLGQCDKAHAAFTAAYASHPKDIEAQYYFADNGVLDTMYIENIICTSTPVQLQEWADVYIQNGMPCTALVLYKAILEIDPEYFPAQIGQAEMLSTLEYYSEALEIYQNLLVTFPKNAKLMVAVARITGWFKNYDLSIQYYDDILKINPYDPVLYREKARTALWGKQFPLAMATYDELLEMLNDSYSDNLIRESIVLEKRAKTLVWDKRYISSLDAYKELTDFNPSNQEALFDYAQSNCIIGLCDRSKDIYAHILNLNPNHGLVKKAWDRNEMRSHFGMQGNFSYWREIGSGTFAQSQIARYKFDTVFELPLSCRSHVRFIQQEYVENPFFNFKFYPAEGQTIESDCIFNEYVSGFVSATYKTYFHQFKSTFSSHNRLLLNMQDYFQVVLGCNREDEIYNYFSLKEAIQSINSWVTVSSNITRYWNIGGTYQNYSYNDHNNQTHFNLITEYQFSEDPHVFKIILQGNYRNAVHQSIVILCGTTEIDVIHPYWTPDKYFSGSITLEIRRDFRDTVYCEAPQRYIDIKITGETDNVNNPSIQAILECKYDFDTHWGFELKGLIQRSKQWNAEGAWGTLSYRF